MIDIIPTDFKDFFQRMGGSVLFIVTILVLVAVLAIILKTMTGGGNPAYGEGYGGGGLCGMVPSPYSEIFKGAGEKWDVQPAFIAAVFLAGEHHRTKDAKTGEWLHEFDQNTAWPSENGPWASSEKGASGPFQFMPGTWDGHKQYARPNIKYDSGDPNVQDLYDASYAAAHKLAMGGAAGNTTDPNKLRDAAASYNDTNWEHGQTLGETSAYVDRVMQAFDYFYCPPSTSIGSENTYCSQKVVDLAKAAADRGDPITDYREEGTRACTAFTSTLLRNAGADVQYTESAQDLWDQANGQAVINKGEKLDESKLKPGDVVFFKDIYVQQPTDRYFDHTGIYIGNDKFVGASSKAKKVVTNPLSTYMGGDHFGGAKRFCIGSGTTVAGNWIWPAKGTGPGANGKFCVDRGDHYHNGIDISADYGVDVVATRDGKVTAAATSGFNHGNGLYITIDHKDGFSSMYLHLNPGSIKVSVGQEVKQGDHIADVGSTGNSEGPHLHFVVKNPAAKSCAGAPGYDDPLKYLPKKD